MYPKRVTLRKVAAKLGVSPSTVSRALNNSSQVSEETKQRVRHAYIELGGGTELPLPKKPVSARSVAVLISRPLRSLTKDEFFSQVISGIIGYAEVLGCHILLSPIDGRRAYQRPRILQDHAVDAFIVGGISISERYHAGLAATGIPVVYIGKHDITPGYHAIIPDNVAGGRLAGKHLLDCGYDRLYCLVGSQETPAFRDRLEGFRQALAESGRTMRAADVISTTIDRRGGYESMMAILSHRKSENESVGVFAVTDWMAAGALQALHERGVLPPDRVGLVGYSDLELTSHLSPPLTTVRTDAYALGHLSLRLVEDLWTRITLPTQMWIQPQLVVRGTTRSRTSEERTETLERTETPETTERRHDVDARPTA